MLKNVHRPVKTILIVIFLLALLSRIAAILIWDMSDLATYSENGQIAMRMFDGFGFTFQFYNYRIENPLQSFMPPLYTWIIYFCLTTFTNPAMALGIIHVILSMGSLYLTMIFTWKLTDNRAITLLVTAATAFYPVSLLSITRAQTLPLNHFLVMLLLVTGVMLIDKQTMRWAIINGVIIGITMYSRPILIGTIPIFAIWLYLNRRISFINIAKLVGLMLFFALLLVSPWTIRNYLIHDRFILMSTNNGLTFWIGNNSFSTGSGFEVYTERAFEFMEKPLPDNQPVVREMYQYPLPAHVLTQINELSEVELNQALFQAGLHFIQEYPSEWRQLLWAKFKAMVWFRDNIGSRYQETWTLVYKIIYPMIGIPALIGFFISVANWRKFAVLYMLFVYYILGYVAFAVQTRYRWEIEPLLFIFAILSLYTLLKQVGILSNFQQNRFGKFFLSQ